MPGSSTGTLWRPKATWIARTVGVNKNILESLGKRNKARLEAACQVLLDTGQGPGTYSTIKRIMATIDSDTKKPRTVTPAAATRKPASGADPGAGIQTAVHVRSAEHYRRGGQGGQG
ncbi:hypothetical protein [Arthrobacter nitrophenolicus]|uniref:hypothetical protein n=1 Tax=Arthrobacter nitrophenolicus TaxID=683150 RepID=UPI00197AA574|nr:hypothetical protein [Arthrobacter nitrophenolicus]